MDVSLLFQSEAGDREIEEILQQAGAMRSGELHSLAQTTVHDQINAGNNPSNNQSTTEPSRAPFGRLFPNIRDSSTQEPTALLAIALFLANTTYQSMLSPPGGVWQDDEFGNNFSNDTKTTIPHIAGQAVMSYHHPHKFAVFQLFISLGFLFSAYMIIILTDGIFMHWILKIAVAALVDCHAHGIEVTASQASTATKRILARLLGSFEIVVLSILYLKWRARNALSLKDQVRAITEGLVQRLQIWTFWLNDFLASLQRPEQTVEP
ncbi:unnamed protein product [Ilex paraguariensis]|uniref:PGG domain-containing protein n=1 Tax=Ilex paraguariensis TaxID=185542 RepID=A0ABC8QWG5_9AQUA